MLIKLRHDKKATTANPKWFYRCTKCGGTKSICIYWVNSLNKQDCGCKFVLKKRDRLIRGLAYRLVELAPKETRSLKRMIKRADVSKVENNTHEILMNLHKKDTVLSDYINSELLKFVKEFK